jgi:hypothetical protein
MEQKTQYCGSGKKQSDSWLKITIDPTKLNDYIQEYQGKKFVKLNINIKPQPDQFGKDVSVSIDTWQPEPKQEETDELDVLFGK